MFGAAIAAVLIQIPIVTLRPQGPSVLAVFVELLPFWLVRAALGLAIWALADWVQRRHLGTLPSIAVHVAGALAFWTAWSAVMAASPILPPSYAGLYVERVVELLRVSVLISAFIYACVVGAHRATHYLGVARRAELRSAELETRLARARLETLRAQLNPHFLFNTLNGISALAMQENHEQVVQALALLGDLLRSALADGDVTTIDRELAFASQYLELQRIRLGERLTVIWVVEAGVAHCRVPVMVLQPIVENAVVHGIEPRAEGGWVRIAARRSGGRVRIEVANSGIGPESPAPYRTGMAGVEARLQHIYGRDYRLEFARHDGPDCLCLIEIPYDTNHQDAHR
jgi:hypothetical protein